MKLNNTQLYKLVDDLKNEVIGLKLMLAAEVNKNIGLTAKLNAERKERGK